MANLDKFGNPLESDKNYIPESDEYYTPDGKVIYANEIERLLAELPKRQSLPGDPEQVNPADRLLVDTAESRERARELSRPEYRPSLMARLLGAEDAERSVAQAANDSSVNVLESKRREQELSAETAAALYEQELDNPTVGQGMGGSGASSDTSSPLSAGFGDSGGSAANELGLIRTGSQRYVNEIDPATAARQQEVFEQAQQIRKAAVGHQGKIVAASRETAAKIAKQQGAMEALRIGGEEEARRHIARMSQAYDEAEIDMASLRVDPKRWEEDTPALAQVFMALGSAAFSFMSGGQGPNPIVSLIENAIERDMKAQMFNIENQMNAANLKIDKEQVMGKLQENLRTSMWERATNTMEQIMNQGTLEMGAMEKEAALAEMNAKLLDVELARLEQYNPKRVDQYTTAAALAASAKPKPPLEPKFVESRATDATAIADNLELLNRVGVRIMTGRGIGRLESTTVGGWIASLFPSGKYTYEDENGKQVTMEVDSAASLQKAIESAATIIGRRTGQDVGNFAAAEAERMIKNLQGGDWDTAIDVYRNLMSKTFMIANKWDAVASGLGETHNISALEPQRMLIARAYARHKKMMANGR